MGNTIFSATGTFSSVTNLRSIGYGFEMGPDSFSLDHASFLISRPSTPHTLTIYSNNNGSPGSVLFSSFTQTVIETIVNGTLYATFTFRPASFFAVQANLGYWFVVSNDSPFTATGTADRVLPNSPVATFLDYQISVSGPVPTSSIPGFIPPRPTFVIEGDLIPPPPPPPAPEVPEPSTALLIIGALVLFRLSPRWPRQSQNPL